MLALAGCGDVPPAIEDDTDNLKAPLQFEFYPVTLPVIAGNPLGATLAGAGAWPLGAGADGDPSLCRECTFTGGAAEFVGLRGHEFRRDSEVKVTPSLEEPFADDPLDHLGSRIGFGSYLDAFWDVGTGPNGEMRSIRGQLARELDYDPFGPDGVIADDSALVHLDPDGNPVISTLYELFVDAQEAALNEALSAAATDLGIPLPSVETDVEDLQGPRPWIVLFKKTQWRFKGAELVDPPGPAGWEPHVSR